MSSDYLCYQISKELHDLGVEFKANAWYCLHEEEGCGYVELRHKGEVLVGEIELCAAPSTAQLIDKLREYGRDFAIETENLGVFVYSKVSEPASLSFRIKGECITACLGEALIKLTKEQNDGQ